METYNSHLAYLIKAERLCRAERQGFSDARIFEKLMKFSTDKEEQNRYADGFFVGKEKLRFDTPITREGKP